MAKKSRKKESKNETKSWGTKILGVLSGTALIAFCICLILAMAGYNPSDESFNVSNSEKISNFMGRFGSQLWLGGFCFSYPRFDLGIPVDKASENHRI